VLNSNVVIRGLFSPGSVDQRILQTAIRRLITPVYSFPLLDELTGGAQPPQR